MSDNTEEIRYQVNTPISVEQFVQLLTETSLGARRPLEDRSCMEAMLKHADLLITAWSGEKLVGVARSVTDFHYCCYLSDLAVSEAAQHKGIGKALIVQTCRQLQPNCKLILLAAPLAQEYYPKLGFDKHPSAWTIISSSFS